MEDGEDSAGGPSQRTHLAESSAETSAERSRQLATLRKGSFFLRAIRRYIVRPGCMGRNKL